MGAFRIYGGIHMTDAPQYDQQFMEYAQVLQKSPEEALKTMMDILEISEERALRLATGTETLGVEEAMAMHVKITQKAHGIVPPDVPEEDQGVRINYVETDWTNSDHTFMV